jgi:aryl-alcohol dehydrogenase-like predicted oxidoreductase
MAPITRRTFVGRAALATCAGVATSAAARLRLRSGAAAGPPLPTRAFGRTGVRVSLIGLGGGGRFFEPVPDDDTGAELVRRAIERGITYIETAANYGPPADGNQSERRIGMAMKTHRARVFLETKTDARDHDGAMREMERSLKLLNTDRIDLLLHHNLGRPEEVEALAGADGAEKAVRKMVDQKVVRFRGFSCHHPALTLEAMARLEPDALQAPINATRIPDFEADVLPLARSRGIAVIAMKVTGHGFFMKGAIGGAFDSRFKTDPHPELHRFAPPPEAFDGPHPSPEEFLEYALALPISTALVGLDSIATLDSIVAAASTYRPTTTAQHADVHRRAQVFAGTGYWIPRQRG